MSLVTAVMDRRRQEEMDRIGREPKPKRVRETKCPVCGKRTRDQTGRCRDCRTAKDFDMRLMSNAALVAHFKTVKAELDRRRAELDEAVAS